MSDSYKVPDNDITIHKANEVYVQIDAERGIIKEMAEYFTFMVPGHKFNPLFKNRMWDGKIRLLNLKNQTLYFGLLSHIEEFAKDREYTIGYADSIDLKEEYSVYLAEKFYSQLDIHSRGTSITVHDYQSNAFVHFMRNRRALIVSPTGSGKSLLCYLIAIQMHVYKQMRGLIIVPTVSLVEQLASDFIDYSSEVDLDTTELVHKIYSGKEKHTDKAITISTWQSLQKMDDEYFTQFDYVIGDEAHLCKSKEIKRILCACTNAGYRLGMTGTLDGTKTHKLVLEGLFGELEQFTSTKELIDKKILSKFEIKCLVLKHNDDDSKEIKKKKDYKEEIAYLIKCEARNKFIKNLALSMKNNTLVLYQYVDKHGKLLYDAISNSYNIDDRKVFYIHGGINAYEREKIRKLTEQEENAIIVASFGTFSTGINIKNLHNIIFASPSKSRVRNLQSIGRGLRINEGKEKAVLYDIADDMRVGKYMNFTLKHFVERVKIYTEEEFLFKLYKIRLKNGS